MASLSPDASSRFPDRSSELSKGLSIPALHRMELDGLIESYWGTTENNRKAKYYRLTRRGTRQLASETERWHAIAGAIAAILQEG